MKKSNVSLVKCPSYEPAQVFSAVQASVALLGGMAAFVKPKSKVLVKPNLLMAKLPDAGITTHPEVIRAVVRLLKELDCTIYVGDGPSVWGRHADEVGLVYRTTGMEAVCAQEGVELVRFDKKRWRGKFPLTTWIDNVDHVVNVPKFKMHNLTVLTGGLKNLFGMVSGTFKTELHKKHYELEAFAAVIVDIYQEVMPALTIVDGIIGLEGDGPATAGKLCAPGVLVASSDAVAVDSVLAQLAGIAPFAVLTTKLAHQRGLGQGDPASIAILGASLDQAKGRPFLLPSTSTLRNKIPQPVINLVKTWIKHYPYLLKDKCIRCATCVVACPMQAVQMENHLIRFDYTKCISCFCCQEMCPASAIRTKKSLFAKLIGL
jgi:uncharacterized protein (DUF362 family)/Pyruvate/2-oxoacid:ferredoxin oxidoreductase delta subunit